MTDMFFFGTLRHAPVLNIVLGADCPNPPVVPAQLPGYAAHWVRGQGYPALIEAPGDTAPGVLVRGLNDEAVARLTFYGGGRGYQLRPVMVEVEGAQVAAQVWFLEQSFAPGDLFDLADWQARWAAVTEVAAAEVMAQYGRKSPQQIAHRYPSIRARAAATVNARQSSPTTLRRAATREDVQVAAHTQAYANFFSVEEYQLSHTKFDGSKSDVLERAAFVSTDAVTVLPYDPRRDRVLLIEQFRMGPFARGDAQCWSLEAIAGRIEPGEPTQETARREAIEEAGLEIGEMRRIANYYASPGAKSEYIYSYLACCDLPDDAGGLGGLLAEGEDIRAHVVTFDHAMALMQSGEIENAPLIVSLQWLALHREELRASA